MGRDEGEAEQVLDLWPVDLPGPAPLEVLEGLEHGEAGIPDTALDAAGFTVASMLCGMAWDIRSMIAFRALQGFFGGVMIPTAFTAAVVLFRGKHKAAAASCVSAAAGLAPALGPVIGGWITDNWSWHWLFYINIVPGAAVAVLAPVFVRFDKPDLTLLKGADYLGMILMAVCLGCLDCVLEDGARWEWFSDSTVRMCAWIAALTGVGFIIRSLTYAHPIVELRAFASRNFALGCWFSFVTGVGIFGLIYLTPLFLVTSAASSPGRSAAPSCGPGRFSWPRSPFTASLLIVSICDCC